jgi:D-alanyl-D-alanine carboxypeptidase
MSPAQAPRLQVPDAEDAFRLCDLLRRLRFVTATTPAVYIRPLGLRVTHPSVPRTPPTRAKHRLFTTVATFMLTSTVVAAPASLDAGLARAYAAIDRALATSASAAVVVGITDRQRLRRVITHGYADLKTRTPLTANSRFALGSISKSFTAVALMQLADEGRFDAHEPITRYLPWLEVNSPFSPIEGHHLLSHTSGLPNYLEDVSSSRFSGASLRAFTPAYPPGAHWWYSNTGFQLLGYALEDLDGAPYRSIIQRRVLDALGMTSSAAVIDDAQRTDMVVSYTRWPYDGSYVEASWFEYAAGDGSIVSTAPDMCSYLRLFLNRGVTPAGRLLSERAFAALTTPVLEDYAYGLNARHDDDGTVIGHSGSIYGFHTHMEAHMEDGFGLIVLTSGGIDNALERWIVKVVAAAFRGVALPPAPQPQPAPGPVDLDQYAGTYRTPDADTGRPGATLAFVVSGSHLELKTANTSTALERMGIDAFRTPNSDPDNVAFIFARVDGKLIGVSHGQQWLVNSNAPAAPQAAVPGEYTAYVGHYENHGPEGPTARVFVRNGRLIAAVGDLATEVHAEVLEPLSPALFRVGDKDYSPERAVFDSIVGGHALRVRISGVPLYRMDTP